MMEVLHRGVREAGTGSEHLVAAPGPTSSAPSAGRHHLRLLNLLIRLVARRTSPQVKLH